MLASGLFAASLFAVPANVLPQDSIAQAPAPAPAVQTPVAGPPAPRPAAITPQDASSSDASVDPTAPPRSTFGRDLDAGKWEMAAIGGIVLIPRIYRAAQAGQPFHFHSEGWFGRDTYVLGMDKGLHAWKAYVITDVVQSAIARRTGDSRSAAITAGLFGMAVTTLAEAGDGFSKTTGFSYEDEVSQVVGIGLSIVRNTVPGLRDKLDFRLQLTPKFNGELSTTRGREANSKYLLALQLAGFPKLERSPLRFIELHLGYFARGFTDRERLRGDPLSRHGYVGIGFNIQQLFARHPSGTVERLGKGVFDYIQVPRTSVNADF